MSLACAALRCTAARPSTGVVSITKVRAVAMPKVEKLRKVHGDMLKDAS